MILTIKARLKTLWKKWLSQNAYLRKNNFNNIITLIPVQNK